jgi:bacterioferritin-associated ferredoxin
MPMIICLCKGVSDRQIREMAQQGQSLRQIVTKCEAGTSCGACVQDVQALVKCESPAKQQASSMTRCQ